MQQIIFKFNTIQEREEQNRDKPTPRNAVDDIKEQIWERIILENKKANRKMFFIKTGGLPISDLLSIKKWAESTDNFSRAFYGALRKFHLQNK